MPSADGRVAKIPLAGSEAGHGCVRGRAGQVRAPVLQVVAHHRPVGAGLGLDTAGGLLGQCPATEPAVIAITVAAAAMSPRGR